MAPVPDFVIADTSALVALVVEDDATHGAALRAAEKVKGARQRTIVPAEVFAETVNILGKLESNSVAITAADYLLASPSFLIVGSNPELLASGIDLLRRQKASVSFIDALVMAYADRYETKHIFGFDKAFIRNGYETPDNPKGRRTA